MLVEHTIPLSVLQNCQHILMTHACVHTKCSTTWWRHPG